MGLDWGKTYASLSGGFLFPRKGVIRHFYHDDPGATERLPRTAIVFNNDYIYFIVVDGRSWQSQGMTIDELATLCPRHAQRYRTMASLRMGAALRPWW